MIAPDNIRIVMINTSDSGNTGAAARALKTMGFSRLYLVDPQDYPSQKATSRASGASDVLHQAVVTETFAEAVADCHLVVGTSARIRSMPIPMLNPRSLAQLVVDEPDTSEIAIVFGRENSGLNNDELLACHYHVSIPGNPDYCVLNVASAVQLICYELRMSLVGTLAQESMQISDTSMVLSRTEWDEPLSTKQEMDGFFDHLEAAMVKLRFYDPDNPRQILNRLRRLYSRTRLDRSEMNLMRGILTRIERVCDERDKAAK